MHPFRMTSRLISATRIVSRPLSSRPAVCFYRHQRRAFGQSIRLSERAAALPTEETRELASHGAPDIAAEQMIESQSKKHVKFIKTANPEISWHPVYLRDSCSCSQCRDPASTQKTFQTTDIPANIEAKSVEVLEDKTVKITWKNDIPGFGPGHVSTFSIGFLTTHLTQRLLDATHHEAPHPRIWRKKNISKELESINFEDYMKDDEILHRALVFLHAHGLLLLKGVPESETAVEDIAGRMGNIRDTFYGRTWDVKSVPEAKNVAYTHQYLGLHMDLLYMANPPGFQLLHCLKNTCEGGSSLFSDAFQAAYKLPKSDFRQLTYTKLAYQYKNAGEHYYHSHFVIKTAPTFFENPLGWHRLIEHVNYSPPFQADHLSTANFQRHPFPQILRSLRKFASLVESPENLYEYRMQEGDCVIFNNRRVLHGRREFDANDGERWLKGTYVDTDTFMSRWRMLNDKYKTRVQRIYDALEETERLGPEESRLKKPLKPINYGSPFVKKAVKKAAEKAAEEAAKLGSVL